MTGDRGNLAKTLNLLEHLGVQIILQQTHLQKANPNLCEELLVKVRANAFRHGVALD